MATGWALTRFSLTKAVPLTISRGTQPTALLLMHRAAQQTIDRLPQIPLPSLEALVATTEALAIWARPDGEGEPAKVAAVALNTDRLDDAQAREEVERIREMLGLPCTDPIRWGAEPLLKALLDC